MFFQLKYEGGEVLAIVFIRTIAIGINCGRMLFGEFPFRIDMRFQRFPATRLKRYRLGAHFDNFIREVIACLSQSACIFTIAGEKILF